MEGKENTMKNEEKGVLEIMGKELSKAEKEH